MRDSISHGDSWDKRQSFIAGFCKAGLNLEVPTSEEIQDAIDKAHVSVYGQYRAEDASNTCLFKMILGSLIGTSLIPQRMKEQPQELQ